MNKKTKSIIIISSIALALIGVGFLFYKRKGRKMTEFKRKLVTIANEEWDKWNKPTKIVEGNADTLKQLRSYWNDGAKVFKNDNYYINEAWSSAFISWLMFKAGAGKDWKYSQSHSVYITDTIKNRKQNNSNPFKGYKVDEVDVQVGDLVCKPRQNGVTYDSPSGYMSHCDLVVAVDSDNAVAIGGNVSNSVSKTTIPLKNGKVDKTNPSNSKWFVVIKNKK